MIENGTNNGTIGPVTSGNLTGLDVTLINNGEIQGARTSGAGGNALTITSPLKLTNNGWIRGAGGRGGSGGKGANNTYIKHNSLSGLSFWKERDINPDAVEIYESGKLIHRFWKNTNGI